MSFFGKVRSLFFTGLVAKQDAVLSPGSAPAPAGDLTIPPAEAERIRTENVREWMAKLEREGNRTGNRRLLQQARNIRQRLGVP